MALETPVVHLEYKRGDSRAIVFVLSDKVTGDPLDLTGYTAPVMAVNSDPVPVTIADELFKVTGVIDGDPTTGRVSFSPTSVQTDETPSTYFYDAQIVDAASGLLTFVEGNFVLKQDRAKD